jgi:hypothetical protein
MAIVPGSGAIIKPIFNPTTLGVDSVIVENGGSGYSASSPPKLSVGNCGNPVRDAVLKPIIKGDKIVAVRILDPGEGYDPLRVNLTPIYPEGTSVENLPTQPLGEAVLKDDGSLEYIKVTQPGDNQYYPVTAELLGGEGNGAEIVATSGGITGLVLLNSGRNYETPPFLSITGGGGDGATGVADIDTTGIVDLDVSISNPGQFYLREPYVLLIGGGGSGAKAKAVINQGEIVDIEIIDQGKGYLTPPKIVFARNVKLKRKSRNRQAYNLELFNFVGLTVDADRDDTSIYLNTTDPLPGSGVILLEKELIRYTGKDDKRLTGCTRGLNFRYDQRIVLDSLNDDEDTGLSTYNFSIGDRILRLTESANNKIAIVYDWNPATKELFIVFKVDELAFIDAGTPGEKTNVVFDGGVADSAQNAFLPHVLVDDEFGIIYKLSDPLSTLVGFSFEDTAEFDGEGNGLPDLYNDGTAYENQTSLDSGIPSTLYGIEETQGGQNTTLFEDGDQIKDSSLPFKIAQIVTAGGLDEGVEHYAKLKITLNTANTNFYNGIDFVVGETVTGNNSGVQATVDSWNSITKELVLKTVVPYNTGTIEDGFIYEFSQNSTVIEVRINEVGSGYTTSPSITIADTGVFQATATASITADQVTSIIVNDGGYGYTSKPSVTIAGDGTGAVAECILGGERLLGANGASWTIASIEYITIVRNDND